MRWFKPQNYEEFASQSILVEYQASKTLDSKSVERRIVELTERSNKRGTESLARYELELLRLRISSDDELLEQRVDLRRRWALFNSASLQFIISPIARTELSC